MGTMCTRYVIEKAWMVGHMKLAMVFLPLLGPSLDTMLCMHNRVQASSDNPMEEKHRIFEEFYFHGKFSYMII
jgi:hypothetical protein